MNLEFLAALKSFAVVLRCKAGKACMLLILSMRCLVLLYCSYKYICMSTSIVTCISVYSSNEQYRFLCSQVSRVQVYSARTSSANGGAGGRSASWSCEKQVAGKRTASIRPRE